MQKSGYTKRQGIFYLRTLFRSSRNTCTNLPIQPCRLPHFFPSSLPQKLLGDHTGYNTQGQLLRHVVSSLRNPNMQCNAQSDLFVLELKRQRAGHGDILQKGCVMSHSSFLEREFNGNSVRFHGLVFQLVRATNHGQDIFQYTRCICIMKAVGLLEF